MLKLFSSRVLSGRSKFRSTIGGLAILLLLLSGSRPSQAYSVLTHEEIIDLLWNTQLRPMILARYPGLTDDQIREAHAFAYGGAVIQDMGYYPFGNQEFSDLVHYVRSGDFVWNSSRRVRTPTSMPLRWERFHITHRTSPVIRR